MKYFSIKMENVSVNILLEVPANLIKQEKEI